MKKSNALRILNDFLRPISSPLQHYVTRKELFRLLEKEGIKLADINCTEEELLKIRHEHYRRAACFHLLLFRKGFLSAQKEQRQFLRRLTLENLFECLKEGGISLSEIGSHEKDIKQCMQSCGMSKIKPL